MSYFIKKILALIFLLIITPATPAYTEQLIISHSSNMPPLSFINEEGEPDGILVDLWKEWSKQSKMNIVFDLRNWNDALGSTLKGETHINGGMYYSEKRAKKWKYGDYLFTMKGALFAADKLGGEQKIDMQESICGVIKGGYAKNFMEEHYPYTPLMLFESSDKMFETAAAGRINLFVTDYPVAIYQLHKFGIENSFTCIKTLYERQLYPAASKAAPDIIELVNKGIAEIPAARKNIIMSKWLDAETENIWQPKTITTLAAIALIAIIFAYRPETNRLIDFLKSKQK
ncbi:transporter substrate-binding domain-containing protein [Maridesulfovibrio hydrothermalis]|uniref:Extracellular solute-binding protein family 3 n=1 Tax=Maridesulfovibrio hydrothermalis AM13 = DSM 14728 TaxID=1121451 RepID=L0REW6_9BACT|nr:transporter substrate-binding domain-containing protein [Maridesulfovibrio hydrothermalis]CCO25299.1 Extracellular solute-binding protein family 3 [Maridesulfovibrio hydrothermalis AM13 = DSM 14728]